MLNAVDISEEHEIRRGKLMYNKKLRSGGASTKLTRVGSKESTCDGTGK